MEERPFLTDMWSPKWVLDEADSTKKKLVSMTVRCDQCGVQFLSERSDDERKGGFRPIPGGYQVICKNEVDPHFFKVKAEWVPEE